MERTCGLLTLKNEPVPLKSVSVELSVQGFVADVSSTLQYENQESSPVEAVFVFPMESDSAVYRFQAQIGGVLIEAEVREKQEARDEYDDAVSSGQQAFLLEESDESSDVFRLSVGSLPPGQSASVSLSYVTELAVQEDGALRFCLPGVLNPRYTPAGGMSMTASAPAAPGGFVPYSLSLSANIRSPSGIDTVQSNCPLDPLEHLTEDKTEAKVNLSPGHKFDRDVELLVYYKNAHQPTTILEAGLPSATPGSLMADAVAMLSFYPEFPVAVLSSLSSCGEFIFLVDRSGSMDCPMSTGTGEMQRIKSARDTLLLLLKSLPLGCYFNIYGFGSTFESFFPDSVEYTQETMDSAVEKVKTMEADLGGTEILEPLKEIYRKPCRDGHPRQLFVFTDGEVGNTKEVTDLVKINALSHRCFTFGIGEGASSSLIKGMAREGSGHPQFITGTDRMQPKVMQSLRFALQPAVHDISVKWDLPPAVNASPLSPPLKVLFQGQRALLYIQLTGQCDSGAAGSVNLQYTLADASVKNELKFNFKPDKDSGLTIHRLGARTLIRSLEGEEREKEEDEERKALKKKAIELSTQSGVSCSHTAFIGVNKDSKEPVQGPLQRRNIPTARMYGYAMPMCAMACSAPMMFDRCSALEMLDTCCYMSDSYEYGEADTVIMKSEGDGVSEEDLCDAGRNSVEVDTYTIHAAEPEEDPMLQLISLQRANGSWDLDQKLASVLGKTEEEIASKMPGEVPNNELWATVLALLWLYGFKLDSKDEWQFLAMKAVSWIKGHKGLSVTQCMQVGNTLLGCQVEPQTLGL
ncbi:von Willebrand factor A domain-containing protein 5A isoform X2 [Amia ocellicauda]|uniref:von Willebrand factor A domain-containing protein 5A isoform X2 n=1 Tax=Amia ocellicauda TaxID=2972642 RepID=UPI00346432D5